MRRLLVPLLCLTVLASAGCSNTATPISTVTPTTVSTPITTGASPSPSQAAEAADAPKPVARAGPALGYDPLTQQLILVGGMADPLNPPSADVLPGRDMWVWQPATGWARREPSIVPDAGYLSFMVWDAATNRVVLVSQSSSNLWTWDGGNWTPVSAKPAIDTFSGVAFDSDRALLYLLGRPAGNGSTEAMWTWDGSRWSDPVTTPMTWREQAAVTYDEADKKLVVYGGFGDGDTTTWLYDGASWSSVGQGPAPAANQSSSAYDPVNHVVVVHVGGQTWTWDGAQWSLRSTTGPGVRRDEAMTYDSAIGKVVLFGGKAPNGSGETYLNDLWGWDGSSWTRID